MLLEWCYTNRYATARQQPSIDNTTNILSSSGFFDGITTISFTRKLNTGDILEDIDLSGTCVYLLWACCGSVIDGQIGFHMDNRGTLDMVCFPTESECPGGMLTVKLWIH